jgi:hypothetical protein
VTHVRSTADGHAASSESRNKALKKGTQDTTMAGCFEAQYLVRPARIRPPRRASKTPEQPPSMPARQKRLCRMSELYSSSTS